MMTDLNDFAKLGTDQLPFIKRKRIFQSPHTGKIAGFFGRDVRRQYDVYTTMRGGYHRWRKGDGWAISDSILDELDDLGVSRVLIHLGDGADDDVFEFTLRRYLLDGQDVPLRDLEDPSDTQTWVPEKEALHVYPGHAAAMFMYDFYEACERIGWRGYDPELRERLSDE